MPTNPAKAQELSKTLRISFGALSDSLAKQIRDQDLEIDPTKCGHLQLDIDAVNRLRIRGALTDSEAHKVHKRLMKSITNAVQEGRINA
jgi:hypothetical protein